MDKMPALASSGAEYQSAPSRVFLGQLTSSISLKNVEWTQEEYVLQRVLGPCPDNLEQGLYIKCMNALPSI